jgi:hypothetical protein
MRLFSFGLAVLPLLSLPTTWALHAADVGVVDWHKHLVGAPMTGSPVTAPSFYRTIIDDDTKEEDTMVLTTTGNNVLAALKTTDGAVQWRHVFEKEDRILGYWKGETGAWRLFACADSSVLTLLSFCSRCISFGARRRGATCIQPTKRGTSCRIAHT